MQLLHADDVVPGAVQSVREVRARATGPGRVRVPGVVRVHRAERRAQHGRPLRLGSRRVRVHAHPVDRRGVYSHVPVDAAMRPPAGSEVLLG